MSDVGPVVLGLLAVLLLGALLAPAALGNVAVLALVASVPALWLLALGGRGPGRLYRLVSAVLAFGLIAGGFLALERLTPEAAAAVGILGLPASLGIMVWVLAAVPLILLGLVFGLSFRRWRPSREETERLRALARGEADD